MATFEKSQYIVGMSEGGYQMNPRDTGNYYQGVLIGTNWGISAPLLADHLQRIPTVTEMKQLPKETAIEILKKQFWSKHNLDAIKNQSLATLIYDGIVNHGSNGMRHLMQKAFLKLGVVIDYSFFFSKKTITLINRVNSKQMFYAVKEARKQKYLSSSQKVFIKGWLNRLDRIQYNSDNSISTIWNTSLALIGFALITYGSLSFI